MSARGAPNLRRWMTFLLKNSNKALKTASYSSLKQLYCTNAANFAT